MKPILAAAAFFFLAPAVHAADITVLAGGATKDVIEELIPAFEKSTGHKVVPTWAPAPAIRKRLDAGETYDLVISSAPEIDAFIAERRLAPGSCTGLMQTGVGVAVRAGAPKPDISSAEALKRALLAAKTIGHSAGTSGAYVVALMARLGIAEETKVKLRQTPPGVRVGAMLANGEVEIGLQQESEIMHEPGIAYLGPLPPELQKITLYAAGLGAAAKQPDAAKALVKALTGADAAGVIKKHGMQPG
jgi:molybdate transport system substrate-binding protein